MELNCNDKANWQDGGCSIYPLDLSDLENNDRLPHGKFYGGRTPHSDEYNWLLIGSSNLSMTAWESSFELNVLIQIKGKTNKLSPPFTLNPEPSTNPYCRTNISRQEFTPAIWLEAFETKTGLDVILRGGTSSVNYTVEIHDAQGKQLSSTPISVSPWLKDQRISFSCSGKDARLVKATPAPPASGDALACPVVPLLDTKLASISPGLTPDEVRYRWIMRYYGWDPDKKRERPGPYRTPWLEESMNVFWVIDAWREAGSDARHKQLLQQAFQFFARPAATWVGPSPQSDLQRVFLVAATEIDKW